MRAPGGLARRSLLAAIAAGALLAGAAGAATKPSELIIVTADGRRHAFTVELADDDDTRTRGLMHRRALAANAGMLFDYGREGPVAMWMRNTLIPLDMLFIAADGRVANLHERAVPHDETPIHSAGPVRAVLELNGGTVARLGIKPGDRVEHPLFAPR
jgi:uncharacterized protein